MDAVILLWDAADLWGLLAWQALNAFRVPCRLVKAEMIAHTLQSDKPRLLMVPGGPARRKFEALGAHGVSAVQNFVRGGGAYVGFCGGAGLGLSGEAGLGLCPWQRAGFSDRLQHFVSGHVAVSLAEHPLVPAVLPSAPSALACAADVASGVASLASSPLLPVWWPGRFAMSLPPAGTPDGAPSVLARYAGPGPDLYMADLPLAELPQTVLRKWREVYGVSLIPETLGGEPCVVHGRFGAGSYTLSYSHLETPDSPAANAWLAHLLRELGGFCPAPDILPPWRPLEAPVRWDEMAPWCRQMDGLMALGRLHGLLFDRAPWLTGWKNGVPGSGLNNLHLALHVLASREPGPQARSLWQREAAHFAKTFALFSHGAEEFLLARRLSATLPEAVPGQMLAAQRHGLFGSAMHGGGLYQELMDGLDNVLFAALQEA